MDSRHLTHIGPRSPVLLVHQQTRNVIECRVVTAQWVVVSIKKVLFKLQNCSCGKVKFLVRFESCIYYGHYSSIVDPFKAPAHFPLLPPLHLHYWHSYPLSTHCCMKLNSCAGDCVTVVTATRDIENQIRFRNCNAILQSLLPFRRQMTFYPMIRVCLKSNRSSTFTLMRLAGEGDCQPMKVMMMAFLLLLLFLFLSNFPHY